MARIRQNRFSSGEQLPLIEAAESPQIDALGIAERLHEVIGEEFAPALCIENGETQLTILLSALALLMVWLLNGLSGTAPREEIMAYWVSLVLGIGKWNSGSELH